MSHFEHDKLAKTFPAANIAILTISDSRTIEDDVSGRLLQELTTSSGNSADLHQIVHDDRDAIGSAIRSFLADDSVDVIITTGGTGLSRRDMTPESLAPFIAREIPGFGEIFRALSFAEIGAAAMLSRAFAGQTESGVCIFALPGSTNAVRLAMERLILPQLKHIKRELKK